jgi:HEAT repeat protein
MMHPSSTLAFRFGGTFLVALALARPAPALVDSCPTLGRVIKESAYITLIEVEKVSREKRVILFKKVADLKGENPAKKFSQQITDGLHPREPKLILDWAEPGRQAVFFQSRKTALTCIGHYWYDCSLNPEPWWTMSHGRPEMPQAYTGKVSKLRQHVVDILAGKEVVVVVIDTMGAEDFFKRESIYSKVLLRGREYPVQRIRAGLKYDTVPTQSPIVGKGAGTAADVAPLVASLKSADAAARIDAAEELGLIGAAAEAALPALAGVLEDTSPLVRVAAAGGLGRIDPKNDKAVPALTAALKSGDPKVRREAALTLGDLAPEARAAVPALAAALGDTDANVRWAVVEALGRYRSAARPNIAALAGLLKDPDPDLRGAAADALGWIGHRRANAALIAALKDAQPNVRWAVAVALTRIGGPGAEAGAPEIIRVMESSTGTDWHTCYPCYRHLASLGPAARNVLPAVEKRFETDRRIPNLLAALGSKKVVSYYANQLKDKDAQARYYAVLHLGLVGTEAEAAVPALTELLKDPKLSRQAEWAIALIRKKGKERLPALIKIYETKELRFDEWIRKLSADILGWMGPDAREAVPTLEAVLNDREQSSSNVRAAVECALRRIGD